MSELTDPKEYDSELEEIVEVDPGKPAVGLEKIGPCEEEIRDLLIRANELIVPGKALDYDASLVWKRDFVRLIG